ncbi:MAG: helix-turn-helix domain-containing protein [Muribaculaceae bacterium]|nr:helix-turn-helix domain-containing protein [Muribaculaceae bacterium]MCM1399000.1 helix-turn-helix domain-containing protein [Clostridium sp.]MCM1458858.1 helix-turn-helix domain-containing protein [Bacteroides sp.]
MYSKIDCGNRLRRLREAKNKTQQEVASEIGISVDTICKVEQGKRSPSVGIVDLLSAYYKTTADYIIGGYIYSEKEMQLRSKSTLEPKWDVVEQLMDELKRLTT